MNFLEQLCFEWYEYQGYFARRNTRVGPLKTGGFECELDVVAFHPVTRHVIHIEPSMDAHSWEKREQRFRKKFVAGRKYIPYMIPDFTHNQTIEQVALFGLGRSRAKDEIGGGKVWYVQDLLASIARELNGKRVASEVVPEQFPLLRTVQFMCEHSASIFPKTNC